MSRPQFPRPDIGVGPAPWDAEPVCWPRSDPCLPSAVRLKEPQPGAAAQVLSLPADCWPTPAAQEGHRHTLLADCPSGSHGPWRAVAGGLQGLGSGLSLTASRHDLLMTLQPCAGPLPLAGGGGRMAARGQAGSPCRALYVQTCWLSPRPDFLSLCSTLAPPAAGGVPRPRPREEQACPLRCMPRARGSWAAALLLFGWFFSFFLFF